MRKAFKLILFLFTVLISALFFNSTSVEASSSKWEAHFYPNFHLKGTPVKASYDAINFKWGWGSPHPSIPSDYFSAKFTNSFYMEEGIYNLRVHANDGVRVYVDGKLEIDEWNNNQGLKFFGKPIYLKSGTHKIEIHYREVVGIAELRFEIDDLMRDNRWYGMAFSNPDFTGETALLGYQPQIPALDFNWGWGSPAPNIPGDNFSTIFQRNYIVKEGAYNLRVYANDGVQVYVDGKLVIDEWDNDQGLKFFAKPIYLTEGKHRILIKHKELVGVSELRFGLDNLLRDNRWYGLAFPKKDFTGEPVLLGYQPQLPDLSFNWGAGSPDPSIPADNFSTLFQRYIDTRKGEYLLNVRANDGVRVYIDGKLVLDQFKNKSVEQWSKTLNLSEGRHHVLVKYFEETGVAELKVNIVPKQSLRTTYVNYSISLDQMADIQMKAGALTDKKYELWIREDAFKTISNDKGTVNEYVWNLRTGPGTEYSIYGQVQPGTVLSIYGSEKDKDGYTWYHVRTISVWVKPEKSDLVYYLNPRNFTDKFRDKLQFLKLSETAFADPKELNEKILNSKAGILQGKAMNFINAAERHGVNEVYLIAHALLETGNGKSDLATGKIEVGILGENKYVSIQPSGTYIAEWVKVVNNGKETWKWDIKKVDNFDRKTAKNIKKTYNMFGIGAYDQAPETLGSIYAYKAGWFTPESAIEGGAKFINNDYIAAGQDTLYKMRWNPDFAATYGYASHQYASDIGWAYKQTSKMNEIYSMLESYSLHFEIPVYK